MPCPIETPLLGDLAMLGLCACLFVLGRLCERTGSRHGGTNTSAGAEPGKAARPSRRQLGAYTLHEAIGKGAMGEVYRAWHAPLQRWCALKLLPAGASERELLRFEKEVQLTARLNHPNTISVYDYGRASDGTAYYAMELLEGISLQQLVDRHGAQSPGRVIQILLQMCAALSEAHDAGLIHRDIKPDNVVLCGQRGLRDVAKVLDFGLVKQLADPSDTDQTSNVLVGTPLYLSPEAITAPESVGAASDVYGLGAVAYFLLTGTPVFNGRNVIEVCSHHLHSTPERPSRVAGHAIASDLEHVVLDCLEKDPLDRPASAAELGQRLARCVDAGTWSDTDAERWWQNPASFVPTSPTALTVSRLRALSNFVEDERACA